MTLDTLAGAPSAGNTEALAVRAVRTILAWRYASRGVPAALETLQQLSAGRVGQVILPKPTHEARRLGSRPMRWRGSSPVLAAVVAELNAARAKAVTPTEPAPALVEVASVRVNGVELASIRRAR